MELWPLNAHLFLAFHAVEGPTPVDRRWPAGRGPSIS